MKTTLSRSLSRRIRRTCRELRITLSTFMQGAWALFLARFSDRDLQEVVFGITSSGREDLGEVGREGKAADEDLVGLLIETIPLRVQIPDEYSNAEELGDWLRRLQERSAVARSYGYLGLSKIRTLSEVESPRPLFESLLVVENLVEEEPSKIFFQPKGFGRSHYPLELCVLPKERIEFLLFGNDLKILIDSVSALCEVKTLPRIVVGSAKDEKAPLFQKETLGPPSFFEELLANLWRDVLEYGGAIGRENDFFDLGGHSLTVLRLTARIENTLDVEVSPRTIFDAPRLAEMARRLEAQLVDRKPMKQERESVAEPALSFGQERLWFLQKLNPRSVAYNLTGAWRIRGPLDVHTLEKAWNRVVARHAVLRTHYPERSGTPSRLLEAVVLRPLPRVDLSRLTAPEYEMRRISLSSARRAFDLEREPPWRAALFILRKEDFVFLRILHHIASDAWSEDLLRRDLAAFYRGDEPPPSRGDYARLAAQARRRFQERGDQSLDFWRRTLRDLPPLPIHRADSAASHSSMLPSEAGLDLRRELPAEILTRVEALARRSGATSFMVLLAAWFVVLARFFRQNDLAVGVPVSGRSGEESESVVGFFVRLLVLRGRLHEEDFGSWLRRVRELCLDAWAHREVPFKRLVEELASSRSASESPLFQVSFSYQESSEEIFQLDGLEIEELDFASQATHFELELNLQRGPDSLSLWLGFRKHLFEFARMQDLAYEYASFLSHLREDIPLALSAELPRAASLPELPLPVEEAQGSPPQTATERALAEIWHDLLALGAIGTADDFFDLGGHSLLAVRLFASIEERFGIRLPLAVLFQHPTLGGLAKRLEQGGESFDGPVTRLHAGSQPAFFWVCPSGGHLLSYLDLARGLESAAYGLESAGAREMLAAVRSIRPRGPYRFGGWSLGGIAAWEMALRAEEEGEEVELLVLIDSPIPETQGGVRASTLYLQAQKSPTPEAWRQRIDGHFSIEVIAGDHFSLLRPPTVESLARRILAEL